MSFFDQIKNSTLAWVILSVVAIVSLIWAVYSHYSTNKKKRFSVAFSSYEVVKKGKTAIPNLELSFLGKPIENLTISKFAIWNSGNKVIDSSDMVPLEKLTIYADNEEEILDAQIVTETEPTNSFNISSSTSKNVCIDFDYVDSHDGIIVQIFHTGGKRQDSLHIEGKIRGGQPIKYYSTAVSKPKARGIPDNFFKIQKSACKKILSIMMLIDSIMLSFMSSILFYTLTVNPNLFKPVAEPSRGSVILLIGILLIANVLTLSVSIGHLKSAFTIGVPAKLKTYTTYF